MKDFSFRQGPEGGFGITFTGNRPVFIRSVDFDSPAHSSGLRSGDLLMTMNGKNVRSAEPLIIKALFRGLFTVSRYSTKIEVLELLKSARERLHLRVVAGGLAPARHSSTLKRSGRKRGGATSNRLSQQRLEMRYEKARVFHSKVCCSNCCSALQCGSNGAETLQQHCSKGCISAV